MNLATLTMPSPTSASPTSHTPNIITTAPTATVTDDPEAERLLTEELEETLTRLSAAVHTLIGSVSGSRITGAGLDVNNAFRGDAAQLFLQANGLTIAGGDGDGVHSTGKTGTFLPGNPALVDSLRSNLGETRAFMRRLDGERRHLRKHALRGQRDASVCRDELRSLREKLTESLAQQRALGAELAVINASLRAVEEEKDNLTLEAMQLRRFVRSLPPAYASGFIVMTTDPKQTPEVVTALDLAPDRRFHEAFRDKMDVITYKRRFRRAKALHQESAERLEALMMVCEDAASGGGSDSGASLNPWEAVANTNTVAAARKADGVDGGTAAATVPALGGGTGLHSSHLTATTSLFGFPFQLPFSPASPKDEYIRALLHCSPFAEPLRRGREEVLRLSTRLKACTDKGLRALYGVHMDTLRICGGGARPQEVACVTRRFEQHLQKMQTAHRELLFSLVSVANTTTTDVLELENGKRRGSRPGGDTSGRLTRDVATMAVDTSMHDVRAHQMEERWNRQRLRAIEAERACAEMAEQAAKDHKAAQLATQQTLSSLMTLGHAVVQAAHRAQRQGHLSSGNDSDAPTASTLMDPFTMDSFPAPAAAASGPRDRYEALTDPRLGVKLSEATELAVSYLRQLSFANTRASTAAAAGEHKAPAATIEGAAYHEEAEETAGASAAPSTVPNANPTAATVPTRRATRCASSASSVPRKGSNNRQDICGDVNTPHARRNHSRGTATTISRKRSLTTHRKLPSVDSSDEGALGSIVHQPLLPPTPNAVSVNGVRRATAALPVLSSTGGVHTPCTPTASEKASSKVASRGVTVIQLDLHVGRQR